MPGQRQFFFLFWANYGFGSGGKATWWQGFFCFAITVQCHLGQKELYITCNNSLNCEKKLHDKMAVCTTMPRNLRLGTTIKLQHKLLSITRNSGSIYILLACYKSKAKHTSLGLFCLISPVTCCQAHICLRSIFSRLYSIAAKKKIAVKSPEKTRLSELKIIQYYRL